MSAVAILNEPRLTLTGTPGVRSPALEAADLPGPGGGNILFGHSRQIEPQALHRTVEGWIERYGPFIRFRLGRQTVVAIADGPLIAAILKERPDVFGRGRRLSGIIDETGPVGLFTAEGEQWRRQRKLVMKAFRPDAIQRFHPLIATVASRLARKWEQAADSGTVVDVANNLKHFTVDVATALALGEDINTLEHPENPLQADIDYWFGLMGRRLVAPVPYWRWFGLGSDRRLRGFQERRDALIRRVIAATRERFVAEPSRAAHPHNVLEALVAARDATGSEFTDDDVAGNIMTMLLAGEDTVSNAISWLLLDFATRPGLVPALRAELADVFGPDDPLQAIDRLDELRLLEACTLESMRLRPVAPMIGVTAKRDVDVAGLQVQAGQVVLLACRAAARRSGVFPRFDAFEPERWQPPSDPAAPDPRRAALPFGSGPRLCPGRHLAMIEIKAVAATALQRFEFVLDGDEAACREKMTFTVGPRRLAMRFARRERGPREETPDAAAARR